MLFVIGSYFLLPAGHSWVSQYSVSVASPVHSSPPFSEGIDTTLVRVLVPPPHEAEHSDHSPKSSHAQLTTTYDSNSKNNNETTIA